MGQVSFSSVWLEPYWASRRIIRNECDGTPVRSEHDIMIEADVLLDNKPMLAILRHSGFNLDTEKRGSISHIEFDIMEI